MPFENYWMYVCAEWEINGQIGIHMHSFIMHLKDEKKRCIHRQTIDQMSILEEILLYLTALQIRVGRSRTERYRECNSGKWSIFAKIGKLRGIHLSNHFWSAGKANARTPPTRMKYEK